MAHPPSVADADPIRLYRALRRIRRVEEEVERVYPTDVIKSPVHLAIGQEAVSVGVCDVLNADDVIGPTYRSHAAYLAKGGDLNAMMAEMYGKDAGCARGKGGSMHLVGMEQFILGASAVVGTGVPVTAGYALALKRGNQASGARRIAAVFFGDGATEEGAFYETLNFAALMQLPLLFVLENNFYAIHTGVEKRWGNPNLLERIGGFGVPCESVTSGDVFEIRAKAAEAVSAIRDGGGPRLLDIHAYRWRMHVGPGDDFDAGYRDAAEAEIWKRGDPVERVGTLLDPSARADIDAEIETEIAAALAFADAAPFPQPEELFRDVFAD
jgi:TPP-dependent pyruvate/acetoin dehydrogenase alpha subunit